MKAPFSYYGGKSRLAPWIAALLPPHRVYVEPFAGSAAVLFAKRPATHEIINDLNGDLVTFLRVLRERPVDLEVACRLTPYSREEFAQADLKDPSIDDLERARRWWVRVCQSFNKTGQTRTGWSTSMPHPIPIPDGVAEAAGGRRVTIGEPGDPTRDDVRPCDYVVTAGHPRRERDAMSLRCLTLHPEHVELFRLGLRWIETRGWATKHRGPIGLHASVRDPDSAAARRDPISRAALEAIPHGQPLTRGAIAVTANLVDCVPMVVGHPTGRDVKHLSVERDDRLTLCRDYQQSDVTDQSPYGHFEAGRVAWLLEDIEPTTERCPACWGAGDDPLSYEDPGTGEPPGPTAGCPVCGTEGRRGDGHCDPMPARGRQGLWTWDRHDERGEA